jgi:hypothetical protein
MFQKNKSCILNLDEKFFGIPDKFHLEQNIPNPFNIQTAICFSVPQQCSIKLVVHNLHEEMESVLFSGEVSPGKYNIIWNGSDENGYPLKNGSYVYSLEADGFISSRRLRITSEQILDSLISGIESPIKKQ